MNKEKLSWWVFRCSPPSLFFRFICPQADYERKEDSIDAYGVCPRMSEARLPQLYIFLPPSGSSRPSYTIISLGISALPLEGSKEIPTRLTNRHFVSLKTSNLAVLKLLNVSLWRHGPSTCTLVRRLVRTLPSLLIRMYAFCYLHTNMWRPGALFSSVVVSVRIRRLTKWDLWVSLRKLLFVNSNRWPTSSK